MKGREIDFEKLEKVTKVAVRMLDNVIDITDFPVERVNKVFRANRRVGLGIMGFADMLFELGIGYGTEEGRDIARKVMKTIQVNLTSTTCSKMEASRREVLRRTCKRKGKLS